MYRLLAAFWLSLSYALDLSAVLQAKDQTIAEKIAVLKQEKQTALAADNLGKATELKTIIEALQLLPAGEEIQALPAARGEVAASKQVATGETGVRAKKLEFVPAFLASISMILVSELGDKTFFIAAILAMRHSRIVVFVAAISALVVMTILSAMMGFALPSLMPRKYTHYAATCLFLFFGIRLLKDAAGMEDGASEELGEVEEELAAARKEESGADLEEAKEKGKEKNILRYFFSPVFIQGFTMTFLAEWGDRSQIATIALAAAKDPVGVTLGGIIGHSCCTGLAVIGGKLLASKISERTVVLSGGILFLIFAAHSIWVGPEGDM